MGKFRWPWQKARAQPAECLHKYKDFPWYITATYQGDWSRLNLIVKEPYVCVVCGHRINKTLVECSRTVSSERKALEIVRDFENNYEGKVLNQAYVEDMIADMQLVDRKFLEVVGLLDDDDPLPKLKVPKE